MFSPSFILYKGAKRCAEYFLVGYVLQSISTRHYILFKQPLCFVNCSTKNVVHLGQRCCLCQWRAALPERDLLPSLLPNRVTFPRQAAMQSRCGATSLHWWGREWAGTFLCWFPNDSQRQGSTEGPSSSLLPQLLSQRIYPCRQLPVLHRSPRSVSVTDVCPMPHCLFLSSLLVRYASEAGSVDGVHLAGWQGA